MSICSKSEHVIFTVILHNEGDGNVKPLAGGQRESTDVAISIRVYLWPTTFLLWKKQKVPETKDDERTKLRVRLAPGVRVCLEADLHPDPIVRLPLS